MADTTTVVHYFRIASSPGSATSPRGRAVTSCYPIFQRNRLSFRSSSNLPYKVTARPESVINRRFNQSNQLVVVRHRSLTTQTLHRRDKLEGKKYSSAYFNVVLAALISNENCSSINSKEMDQLQLEQFLLTRLFTYVQSIIMNE